MKAARLPSAITIVAALAWSFLPTHAQPVNETGEGHDARPQPTAIAASRTASVKLDFALSRGKLPRTERYNNLTRAYRYVDQRDEDVSFFLEQGLRGSIYRTWIIVEEIYDFDKGTYNWSGIDDYLADAGRLSEELLVVLDTRASMGKLGRTPEQLRAPLKTILLRIKSQHPQIRYIEPFNEPDHNLREYLNPERLYEYYRAYYQVLNEVNRELSPRKPLLIGGPATGSCGSPWAPAGPNNVGWIPRFLDAYAADRDPGKRLDFLSYHAYGFFKNQTSCSDYQPIRTDPSIIAGQRARTDEELRKRGLDVNIPSFITETGGYPGPSYDNKQDARPDYLRQAAIMASYMYWYLENPKDVPFNWVLRHVTEERKDQLITRGGTDRKTMLTRTFTPYGNQMLMFSKLKAERVVATSSALEAGKGVYAIGTKDPTGVAVLVWNYQQKGEQTYRVNVDLGRLPPELRRGSLRQRMFRIDERVSNYWANPATANLQMVSDRRLAPGTRHKVSIELTPNALQLIMIEPVATVK